MKKILFASAAILAISSYAAQAAEPIKLTVGGSMTQWLAYATNKKEAGNYSDVDVQGLGLIKFTGETALDNGLTVGVEVDTLATQGLDSHTVAGGNKAVERSFAYATSKFGQVIAGQQDNVGTLIHVSAPDVGGVGSQDGYWMDFVVQPGEHNDSKQRTYAGDDRSADKIIYITPALYGLQAGFSYTPDIDRANVGNLVQAPAGNDLYVAGLAFNNTFGPIGVKADIGYFNANVGLYGFQGGLQATYGNFTLGGSALRRNATSDLLSDKIAVAQGTSYDVGVSYVVAPFGVSFSYFKGAAANYNDVAKTGLGDDTDAVWTLAGSYDVGPGITWKNSIIKVDWDSASNTAANQNKGWIGVTGMTVAF